MAVPQVAHHRYCIHCQEPFTTYDRNDKYCDNCSYMETTHEWKERAQKQIEELLLV